MWEDQSIETCDDWVIPYIGDLLATNLVTNLDARGQRLDVAKTIYYRRRKGTLAILEEIAFDITGWNAKVVEFFRRLGRTRHGLDPAIGLASIADPDIAALQQAEGLVGPADGDRHRRPGRPPQRLRRLEGRLGVRRVLPHRRLPRRAGTGRLVRHSAAGRLPLAAPELHGPGRPRPSSRRRCPGQFTFDPTGREIPLFAVAVATTSETPGPRPAEWQLPTPITPSLLEPALANDPAYALYSEIDANDDSVTPNALGVYRVEQRGLRADPGAASSPPIPP